VATISSRSTKHAVNAPPENLKRGGKYYQGKGAVLEPQPRLFEKCYPWIFESTQVTGVRAVGAALAAVRREFERCHKRGGRVWFLGNGGSAGIASHLAVDFTKNGGIRASAMNDAPTLTCLANDFGYDQVFAKQLEYYGRREDVVVIISTSGRSLNILNAANVARTLGCTIYTFSGMNPNNVLRQRGDINFYIPCTDYGIVECSHLILLHSII
jgi:D-sedoheptulose 7-phosphate isomerase